MRGFLSIKVRIKDQDVVGVLVGFSEAIHGPNSYVFGLDGDAEGVDPERH